MIAGSDDIFYTYCAKYNDSMYKQSAVSYFTNMKAYNANDAYSDDPTHNVDIIRTCQIAKDNLENNVKGDMLKYVIEKAHNRKIKIFIFNYKHDQNALKWKQLLKDFDVTVLDSGNDKKIKEFVQYPNIYYSGLWNIVHNFAIKNKDYEWIGVIPSDITITNDNVKKLIDKINWL